MPNALKLGISTAGGIIVNNTGVTTNVRFDNEPPVLLGATIANHGLAPHAASTMAQASPNVFIANVRVCHEGHLATCAHAGTGGTSLVIIN